MFLERIEDKQAWHLFYSHHLTTHSCLPGGSFNLRMKSSYIYLHSVTIPEKTSGQLSSLSYHELPDWKGTLCAIFSYCLSSHMLTKTATVEALQYIASLRRDITLTGLIALHPSLGLSLLSVSHQNCLDWSHFAGSYKDRGASEPQHWAAMVCPHKTEAIIKWVKPFSSSDLSAMWYHLHQYAVQLSHTAVECLAQRKGLVIRFHSEVRVTVMERSQAGGSWTWKPSKTMLSMIC